MAKVPGVLSAIRMLGFTIRWDRPTASCLPTVSRWTYPSRSRCRDSITAKHQRTKPLCTNPRWHFGVTFSNSGMTATMHEKVTGNWYEYSELDGGASYRIDPVADR